MIISPPFLPVRSAGQSEESWLEAAMAPTASRLPDTHAAEGSFPLSHSLCWHNGIHIQAPTDDGGNLPVSAVADGVVRFARQPTTPNVLVGDPQNYNPFQRGGAEATPAWTDNGCVIIEHTTAIGAAGATETQVTFYSVYMHLSELGRRSSSGQTHGPLWTAGDPIWRKDVVGQPGRIYGHGGQIHFEICLNKVNLTSLIGRAPAWVEPAIAPVADGRVDSIFGSLYFYLPDSTPTAAGPSLPANHVRGAHGGTALGGATWVKMTYRDGSCQFESFDLQGNSIRRLDPQPDEEYNLYRDASNRHASLPAADKAESSASGWYELLRYGRNIGRGPSVGDKDPLPAAAAHWRRIASPDGTPVWADLNAAGSFKFSDADFLTVMGWKCIDDDSTPNDQRCNSEHLKRLIQDPDTTNANRMEEEELARRVGDDAVQSKFRRIFCKFPSEWERSTTTARYGFVQQLQPFKDAPDAWSLLEKHLQAISFNGLPGDYLLADWRVHPREFIERCRANVWMSVRELLQLVPKNIIRKPGSHNSPSQGVWESPPLAPANTLLTEAGIALNMALRKFLISSTIRVACFIGNAVQETAWFRTLREASGTLPDLHLGWYGRGFLQLTNPNGALAGGNNNYYKYFRFVGRSPHVPPGPSEVSWRDEVGTDPHHAAHSAAAYWAWPDKSTPTTSNPNRPQVDNANRYADVHAANAYRTISTAAGTKIWYCNQSFTDCAAAVNYPATVGQTSPNMNGLVDRSTAFVNALMVLDDVPIFATSNGGSTKIPADFSRRRVP